jgi:glutamate/tyrosine decarboxylase-like PLP-dependent enzyme
VNESRTPFLASPHHHPSFEELERAGQLVLTWALEHYRTLPDQRIGAVATPAELRDRIDHPAPEAGCPFADVLERFKNDVTPFAFRTNHPRFLAFVPGAPSFPSVLGDWLASAVNLFCGVWLEASGPTQVELTVLNWFKTWIGYPAEARGILTSGGSEANLTALVVAREHLPFADRARSVLYVSEQRHWSVDRAAKVIGLHPDQIRPVPADDDLKLRADALRDAVQMDRRAGRLPWVVVANAGATNTGAVDPLTELAALCKSENLWLHIDAAYGWAAVLTQDGERELAGIGDADSVTLDPHKWLAQTFEAGCLLVRDGKRLEETFALRPDYLQDVEPREGEINFADHGIALTRRFRALKIWMSVQVLGLGWFRELAERCCALAEHAQRLLEAAGCFEILYPRQLSIICFRFRRAGFAEGDLNGLNERIGRDLLATGRAFLSSTRIKGKFALRMCFINWRTTAQDVEEIVGLLKAIGERLSLTKDAR